MVNREKANDSQAKTVEIGQVKLMKVDFEGKATMIGLGDTTGNQLQGYTRSGKMENAADFFEAIKAGDLDRVDMLVDKEPTLLTARDEQGVSAILTALYYHQTEILEELLAHHPRLDIWEASATGHLERVNEILEQDPSEINTYSPDGFTPLGLAAFFGQLTILETLLNRGVKVNLPSNNAMRVCPLHSVVAQREIHKAHPMAKLLLESGAEPNARQAGGYTPLHESASRGDIETVKLLCQHGADPSMKNDEGKAAIDFARQAGRDEVVAFLQSVGPS